MLRLRSSLMALVAAALVTAPVARTSDGTLQAEANSHVVNGAFEQIYGSFGDPVAEVDQALSNTDTTIQPNGLPLDVSRICEGTWTCVVGASCGWTLACFDPHPNATGYGVIARPFEEALR